MLPNVISPWRTIQILAWSQKGFRCEANCQPPQWPVFTSTWVARSPPWHPRASQARMSHGCNCCRLILCLITSKSEKSHAVSVGRGPCAAQVRGVHAESAANRVERSRKLKNWRILMQHAHSHCGWANIDLGACEQREDHRDQTDSILSIFLR